MLIVISSLRQTNKRCGAFLRPDEANLTRWSWSSRSSDLQGKELISMKELRVWSFTPMGDRSCVAFACIHCNGVRRLVQWWWWHLTIRSLCTKGHGTNACSCCLWRHRRCNLSSPRGTCAGLSEISLRPYVFTSTGEGDALHLVWGKCLRVTHPLEHQCLRADGQQNWCSTVR